MKLTLLWILAAVALAGCAKELTLEEAQARCARQGGLLTVIYTQQITASGVGQPTATPGQCVSPANFEQNVPAAGATPAK